MLQRALIVGKSWIPSTHRPKNHIYQQPSAESTELRVLTVPSVKSDLTLDTTYQPHFPDFEAPSPIRRRTHVQRVIGDHFTGWRFGILHFAVWATLVFLINLTVTIWGSSPGRIAPGVLMDGDCGKVKQLNVYLHILINILSTILLSGSNYSMQCLSAPTRKEVDDAHSNGRWLDIGIPSLRNIRSLSKQRIILWMMFGLSSLPLHLFYNSAVYGSISSTDYFAFSVSKSFIESPECLNCNKNVTSSLAYYYRIWPGTRNPLDYDASNVSTIVRSLHARRNELERLDPSNCLNEYGVIVQSNRRNVLLVADDKNFPTPNENYFINGSYVFWATPFDSSDAKQTMFANDAYKWICTGSRDSTPCSDRIESIRAASSEWRAGLTCKDTVFDNCTTTAYPVEYCLSEKAEPHCRLVFDTGIAILVTVLNFVKAALMFYTAFRVKDDPLITMGDAVASFLETRDSMSKNMCLSSIKDIKQQGYKTGAREWRNTKLRWKDVTSRSRRFTTLAIFLTALVAVSSCLGAGVAALPTQSIKTAASLVRLGFGTIDPRTAINGLPNALLPNVLVANLPQVILSMLYFTYNALFTSFLLSYEWVSYAHKRKGLRVSRRAYGEQRDTYFLQLPYRFGLPLMALSGLLHWLVSQSIFLIAIDMYNAEGQPKWSRFSYDDESSFMTCGYSPIAMITVLIIGIFMVGGIVAFGFVSYKQGMPLAGSCSMAIASACHLDNSVDSDGYAAAEAKLQWGVTGVSEDGVGHCSFSTKEVSEPVEGQVYAGIGWQNLTHDAQSQVLQDVKQ